nr:hypothetical protein [Mycoplasmopsis bovis]QQH18992.1 hypothetical protein HYE48_00940 [Mycoplasmopsis bovis]
MITEVWYMRRLLNKRYNRLDNYENNEILMKNYMKLDAMHTLLKHNTYDKATQILNE